MITKNYSVTDNLILYYICLFQIFFFHTYNTFSTEHNVLLIFTSFVLALIFFFKNIKQKDLNVDFDTKLLLAVVALFIFVKSIFLTHALLTFSPDALSVLSKDTHELFVFFEVFLLITFIFYIIVFKKVIINFNKLFLIAFFIGVILLTSSIVNILLHPNNLEHGGWMNPFLYLFFFNDNVSSKIQHGYIFLIITLPLIHELYKFKKKIYQAVFVLSVFFIFYIFSKLIILAFAFFLITYNLLYYSKENVVLTVRLLIISFFTIFIFSFLVNNLTERKNSLKEQLQLKFSKILLTLNFETDFITIIKKIPHQKHLQTNKDIVDYYDSTSDRIERLIFCTSEGLEHKAYKKFSLVKISTKYKSGPLEKKYFHNHASKRYFNVNCEGSLINIYYKYENLSVFIYLALFLALWCFFRKKDKFTNVSILTILLLSLQSLTLQNPITYFFIAFLFSRKKDKN